MAEESALDALLAWQMDLIFTEIAPGVDGLVRDTGDEIEIVGLRAQRQGSGAVSAFLDSLPHDRKVVAVLVANEKLMDMLERRGFVERNRFDPRFGLDGWGKVWIRQKA